MILRPTERGNEREEQGEQSQKDRRNAVHIKAEAEQNQLIDETLREMGDDTWLS